MRLGDAGVMKDRVAHNNLYARDRCLEKAADRLFRHLPLSPEIIAQAGLPVARLTEIWRQKEAGYKQAVAAIAGGDILGGYDKLDDLGWIHQTPVFDHNKPLVDAYLAALKDKANGKTIQAAVRSALEKGTS